MGWEVEVTDQFERWYFGLGPEDQDAIDFAVALLEEDGPRLGRPHADTVNGSRHPNMKELRAQSGGKPLRAFYAFDPRRSAILLIGGDKTGDARFYRHMIPIADDLYAEHLADLENEHGD
jgi:hypothetical protein